MRWLVGLSLCCGCNQAFGLNQTVLIDASFFDAPIDAPFACPSIGEAPSFSRSVQQFAIQDCRNFSSSINGTVRIAYCYEPRSGPAALPMGQGQFVPIPAFERVSLTSYDYPQVTPEGDQLFVVRLVQQSFSRIERYTRDGDAWTQLAVVKDPIYEFGVIGSPSAGPTRRLMYYDGGSLLELEVSATGTSTVHDTYNPPDVGVAFFDDGYAANLSPDGLRMVFTAKPIGDVYQRVLYTDRATLADRFRPTVLLPGVPRVADTFLTATCDRVYFSTVQSIFFAQRL